MTLLLFDTEAMDETAAMLRDGAGEYEVLSSQVRADADLGSMPPQTATWVSDVIASVSQSLNQLTSDLSSDADLLAWRSEEARFADDPSLGALAEALFGAASAVGLSSLFADTLEGFAPGVDPLGVPAGCAGCVGGYAAVTYEPTVGEATAETSSSSVSGAADSVVVPIDGDLFTTPDDGSSVSVTFDTPQYGSDGGGSSITIPVWAPGTAPDSSAYPSGLGSSGGGAADPLVINQAFWGSGGFMFQSNPGTILSSYL
jgi:hypothetical protein